MIAGVIASVAVVPAVALLRSSLPHYPAAVIVAPIASGFGSIVALSWLIRWPSRGLSEFFCLAGTVVISAACLVQAEPFAGLLGCSAFAVLAGYIAFFHTPRDMVFNFAAAMATAAVLAARLAHRYDAVLAGCSFVLVLVLNLAFSFAVQWLVHALGSDLRSSSRDTLTGLLTRRTFHQSVHALLLRRREGPIYLGVALIDLDNFKRINDTHGHAVGDKALVAVGGALRLACPPTSMIARLGGEEFVVADTYCTDDLHDTAEELRKAIAAIRFPVTASIGMASAPLSASFNPVERGLIDDLVDLADTVMYAAKRAGGNQSRSAHLDQADAESRSA